MLPDHTTSALLLSQLPTNISHLTQTFPPGCYLRCCQYVIDTNEVTLCGAHLLSPRRVNQKLLTDPTEHRYRSLGGEEQRKGGDISSRNTCIDCVWLSQRLPDWQAIQLSGSKKERKTIIISIISPSPRLPSSIICAHDLMSFVRSETNFTVNITIMSSWFTPAQSHRKTEKDKANQKVFSTL